MRLTRLYIPEHPFSTGQSVALSPEQSHYLLRVLRMEQDQPMVVFNERSGAWQGILHIVGKKALAVLERQIQLPTSPDDIHMLLSPLKKEAWDFCVEKLTELGMAALQPVTMDFTQNARLNEERIRANLVEASQQCERTHVPELIPVQKLDSVLRKWDPNRLLYVALERSDARPALDVFEKQMPGAILIGPEGGFSPRERELLMQYDFVRAINLGPLILRAETAAMAALALWSAKNRSGHEAVL